MNILLMSYHCTVIKLGVITLGVITLGVITVSRQAYTVALPSMCIARQTFFKQAKTKTKNLLGLEKK
jgi:hypothetical protein